MTDEGASTRRIDSLTGLRFLAALGVLLHHTLAPTIVPGGLASVPGTRRLAVVGYVGVTVFFVLSGFVLAWSWDQRRTSGGFYARRFARVWPLHALTWVAVCLVVLPLTDRHGPSVAQHVAGLGLVHAFVPSPQWYFAGNGPSWSLSCEAFFYLLLPFLVPLLRRAGRRAAIVTVVGAAAVAVVGPLVVRAVSDDQYALLSLAVFPPYRVAEFVIGVTLGWAVRGGWRPSWTLRQATAAVVVSYVAAAVLVGGVFFSPVRADRALGNLYADAIVLLPVAALIAALATADLSGRPTWLARPLPVALGAASFAFYLVHVSVIQLVADLPVDLVRTARGLPALVVAVVGSAVLAQLLHRGVERPVELALRQRIAAREAVRVEVS